MAQGKVIAVRGAAPSPPLRLAGAAVQGPPLVVVLASALTIKLRSRWILKGCCYLLAARGRNSGALFLLPWRAREADDDVPHVNALRFLRG